MFNFDRSNWTYILELISDTFHKILAFPCNAMFWIWADSIEISMSLIRLSNTIRTVTNAANTTGIITTLTLLNLLTSLAKSVYPFRQPCCHLSLLYLSIGTLLFLFQQSWHQVSLNRSDILIVNSHHSRHCSFSITPSGTFFYVIQTIFISGHVFLFG